SASGVTVLSQIPKRDGFRGKIGGCNDRNGLWIDSRAGCRAGPSQMVADDRQMVDLLYFDPVWARAAVGFCGLAALGRKEWLCAVLLCSAADILWRDGHDRHAADLDDGADAGAAAGG